MTKKILLLSHCFPPYCFPESYLVTKKLGNMNNCTVDVVTLHAFDLTSRKDENFFLYAQKKFNTITQINAPSFYKYLPFHRLESIFSLPDKYIYLNFLYKKYLKNLHQYDAVITWSTFLSIHNLGCWIKKRYPSLNWVAHFSDPWTTNPFNSYRHSFVFKINKYLERKVFFMSDALIFTSKETLNDCLNDYPQYCKDKAYVIPHAYDSSLYPEIQKREKYPIILSYIGNFYGQRNPSSFLDALKLIEKRQPEILKKIEIRFIGSSQHEILLKDFPYLKVEPAVDYLVSLKKMKESDILLIIDAPFDNSPFLPSKLIDYIGANKPVFGVTPSGTSQKLIDELGFLTAHPSDALEIADRLIQMIERVENGQIENISGFIRKRYSVFFVGKQMLNLLNKL